MLEGWRDGISLLSSRYYENGKCAIDYSPGDFSYPAVVTLYLDPQQIITGPFTKEHAVKIYNIYKNADDREAAFAAVKVWMRLSGLRGFHNGTNMA